MVQTPRRAVSRNLGSPSDKPSDPLAGDHKDLVGF
jgi:hypothetical protein